MFLKSILIFSLLLCCCYGGCIHEVKRVNDTSITASAYNTLHSSSFLTSNDDYELVSPITEFEPGIRQNIIRYLGVPKDERDTYRFDICRPNECQTGKGYIVLCYYTLKVEEPAKNATEGKDRMQNVDYFFNGSEALREKCPQKFASIRIMYDRKADHFYLGKRQKKNNLIRPFMDLMDYYDEADDFHINRKGISCVTAHYEINSDFTYGDDIGLNPRPHFRPANPENYLSHMDCLSYWDYAPFDSQLHPYQTAIILSETSSDCVPRVYLHLPEYVKQEVHPSPSPTPSTPQPLIQLTTPESSNAVNGTTTAPHLHAFHGYLWYYILPALVIICLSIMFLAASIVLNLKSQKKVNKLVVKVLTKRQDIRKELQG